MTNDYWRRRAYSPDDGQAGGAQDPTPGQGTDPGNDGENGGKDPATFEELLKSNSAFQSEFDRKIRQAVESATAKERDRQAAIRDTLQDEVLRVSHMTQEEKDAYFKQKAEKEAKEREASLTRRELTLDARQALQEHGLPDSFLSLLNYADKESMLKSIETLEGAYGSAVQAGVAERLKGAPAPKDAGTEGDKPAPLNAQQKALADAVKAAGIRIK